MAMNVRLTVDASDLNEKIQKLQSIMEPQAFNRRIAGVFRRGEAHIRKINKQDIPKKYYATSTEIGNAFKHAQIDVGGTTVKCTIPLVDSRKKLKRGGGKHSFKAYGGAKGWRIPKGGYRVRAAIVKDGISTLPAHMGDYGGQPPFINTAAPKLNNLVFTRTGPSAFAPITPVPSIAVPQMPMNRAEPEVQADIKKYLENRIDHEIRRIMSSI